MRVSPRLLAVVLLAACRSAPTSGSAPPPASVPASVSASASVPVSASASASVSVPDSGAGSCRVLRGPVELPLRSPAALAVRGESVDVVLNDDGKPRTLSFPAGAPPASSAPLPARESVEGGAAPGYAVPCAMAGARVFCADRSGAVHRTAIDGAGDRVVGSSRAGSRIAAAEAGGHATLAYLASRQTSEGWVSEAWVVVDEDAPVRLSEDGSGATSLALASRGASILAVSVDARTALTAMHARPVTFEGGHAHLGEDVVLFVGGPGDRRTGAAVVARPSGPAWALLPIAKDVGSFGLAAVRVDDPPRVDEPAVWSMYPNGLDPAPVAAAAAAGRTWVARVRPRDASVTSARVLEIGELAPDGGFAARDVVPTARRPGDVSLVADAQATLWLAWLDGDGSWLERLACATPWPAHGVPEHPRVAR